MLPTQRTNRASAARRSIDDLIHQGDRARGAQPTRDTYFRLVHAIRRNTDLLRANRLSETGTLSPQRIIAALPVLAEHYYHWSEAPETYNPHPDHSMMQQWVGFVQHVLEDYSCPKFLSISWLHRQVEAWWTILHLQLSTGRSVRRFRLPDRSRCDRMTAKFFMLAPDDATPAQAFRWAQYMATVRQMNLKSDRSLARLLMQRIPITESSRNETFWKETLRFFARYPVCSEEAHDILNMINLLRFTPASGVFPGCHLNQALDTEFSIASRSLRNVRRLLANWRADYQSRVTVDTNFCHDVPWMPIKIQDMAIPCEESQSHWKIVQLLTPKALSVEGSLLSHCVGGYVNRCRTGVSSIWSLRKIEGEQQKRMVTFEIRPSAMTIVQASGKRNRLANQDEAMLIKTFAEANGLCIASGVGI